MPNPNDQPVFDPNVPPPLPTQNNTTAPVVSTPSYGLTQQTNPFTSFPQVENQIPQESILMPNKGNQSFNSPNPGSAMTVSPDNNSSKFSLFIVILGAIVALIFAGVVFLYFSNNQLSKSLSSIVNISSLS